VRRVTIQDGRPSPTEYVQLWAGSAGETVAIGECRYETLALDVREAIPAGDYITEARFDYAPSLRTVLRFRRVTRQSGKPTSGPSACTSASV
jgi:hypothetical protein